MYSQHATSEKSVNQVLKLPFLAYGIQGQITDEVENVIFANLIRILDAGYLIVNAVANVTFRIAFGKYANRLQCGIAITLVLLQECTLDRVTDIANHVLGGHRLL